MPLNVNPGESREEFLQRCIPGEIKAGKPPKQAQAICFSAWSDRNKKKGK